MSQDITFCMEEDCTNRSCFRHRNHACPGFVHSYAFLRNTELCPLFIEEQNTGRLQSEESKSG